MLKKILVSYLLRKCGNFVDGINQDALETDFWNGKVALRDLKFRADLLASFNLPFKFELTHVGRLELTIPWSSVLSSSVIVEISDVTLLASTSQPWLRSHFEIERIRELVRERLLAKLFQVDFGEEDGSGAEEGRVAQALRKIVERIVVRFRNLHFRLEICKATTHIGGTKRAQEWASTPIAAIGFFTDRISSSPNGAMQARVATCQLCTLYTDVRSRNLLGVSRSLCLQKLQLVCSNLQSLSDPDNLREIVRIQGIEVHLQSAMPPGGQDGLAHDHGKYDVPESAAKGESRNESDHREPLKHEVSVAQVNVRLTPDSIRIVQLVLRHMQQHDRWWRQVNYRAQFRPEHELSMSTISASNRRVLLRSWWHYALELAKRSGSWQNTAGEGASEDESHDGSLEVNVEAPSVRRTLDWHLVRQAAKDRRSYVLAFRKRLRKQKTKEQSNFDAAGYTLHPVASLSASDQKTLHTVEQRYDVLVLAVFRRIALAQHQKSTVTDRRNGSDGNEAVDGGWFGWLWGSGKSSLTSHVALHDMTAHSSTLQRALRTQVSLQIQRLWAELAMPQPPHASRHAVLQLTSGFGCNLTVDDLSGSFTCDFDLSHKTIVQVRETQAACIEHAGYGDENTPSNGSSSSQSVLSTRTIFFFDPLPDPQKSSLAAGILCHIHGGPAGTTTAGRIDQGDNSAIRRGISVDVSTRRWTAEMTLGDVLRFLALAQTLQNEYEGRTGDMVAQSRQNTQAIRGHGPARSNLRVGQGGGGHATVDPVQNQRHEISGSLVSFFSFSLMSPTATVRILLPKSAREVPNSTAPALSAEPLVAELQVAAFHVSTDAAVGAHGLIGKGTFRIDVSTIRAGLCESAHAMTSNAVWQAQTSDLKPKLKSETLLAVTNVHCVIATDARVADKAQSVSTRDEASSSVLLRSIGLAVDGSVTCALSTNAVARISHAMTLVPQFSETQQAHPSAQLTPAVSSLLQSSTSATPGPPLKLARLAPNISVSMRRFQCNFECEQAENDKVGALILNVSQISVAVSSKRAFGPPAWTLTADSVGLRRRPLTHTQRAARPIVHVSAMVVAIAQGQVITNPLQMCFSWEAAKVNFVLVHELVPELLQDISCLTVCLQMFKSSGAPALTVNEDPAAAPVKDVGLVRSKPEPSAVSVTIDIDNVELTVLHGENSDNGLGLVSRGFEFAVPCVEFKSTAPDSESFFEHFAVHSKLQFDSLSLLQFSETAATDMNTILDISNQRRKFVPIIPICSQDGVTQNCVKNLVEIHSAKRISLDFGHLFLCTDALLEPTLLETVTLLLDDFRRVKKVARWQTSTSVEKPLPAKGSIVLGISLSLVNAFIRRENCSSDDGKSQPPLVPDVQNTTNYSWVVMNTLAVSVPNHGGPTGATDTISSSVSQVCVLGTTLSDALISFRTLQTTLLARLNALSKGASPLTSNGDIGAVQIQFQCSHLHWHNVFGLDAHFQMMGIDIQMPQECSNISISMPPTISIRRCSYALQRLNAIRCEEEDGVLLDVSGKWSADSKQIEEGAGVKVWSSLSSWTVQQLEIGRVFLSLRDLGQHLRRIPSRVNRALQSALHVFFFLQGRSWVKASITQQNSRESPFKYGVWETVFDFFNHEGKIEMVQARLQSEGSNSATNYRFECERLALAQSSNCEATQCEVGLQSVTTCFTGFETPSDKRYSICFVPDDVHVLCRHSMESARALVDAGASLSEEICRWAGSLAKNNSLSPNGQISKSVNDGAEIFWNLRFQCRNKMVLEASCVPAVSKVTINNAVAEFVETEAHRSMRTLCIDAESVQISWMNTVASSNFSCVSFLGSLNSQSRPNHVTVGLVVGRIDCFFSTSSITPVVESLHLLQNEPSRQTGRKLHSGQQRNTSESAARGSMVEQNPPESVVSAPTFICESLCVECSRLRIQLIAKTSAAEEEVGDRYDMNMDDAAIYVVKSPQQTQTSVCHIKRVTIKRREGNIVSEILALVCGGRTNACVVEESANNRSVKVNLVEPIVRVASADAVLGYAQFLSDFAQIVDIGRLHRKAPLSPRQSQKHTVAADCSGLLFQLGKEDALCANVETFSVQGASLSDLTVDSSEGKFYWRAKIQSVEMFCATRQFCYLQQLIVKYWDPTFSKGVRVSSRGLHLWLSGPLLTSLNAAVRRLFVPSFRINAPTALPGSDDKDVVAHQSSRQHFAFSFLETSIILQSADGATKNRRYTSTLDSLTLLFESNHANGTAAVVKLQSGSVFVSSCSGSFAQSQMTYFQVALGSLKLRARNDSGVRSPALFVLFGNTGEERRHKYATVAGLKLVAVLASFLRPCDLCNLSATCTHLHYWNQLTPLTRVPTCLVQERSNFEWRRDVTGVVLKIWIGNVSLCMQLEDVGVLRDLNDTVNTIFNTATSGPSLRPAGTNIRNDRQSFVLQVQMSGGNVVWMPREAVVVNGTMQLPGAGGDKNIVAAVGKLQLGMSWFHDGLKTFQLKTPNPLDSVSLSLLQSEGLAPVPVGFEVQALSVKHIFRRKGNLEAGTDAWQITLGRMGVELTHFARLLDVTKSEYGTIHAFLCAGRGDGVGACDTPTSQARKGKAPGESLPKLNGQRRGEQTISFDCRNVAIGLFKAKSDHSKVLDVVRVQVDNASGSAALSFEGVLSGEASMKSLALLYRGCSTVDQRAGGAWEKMELHQIHLKGTRAHHSSPLIVSVEAAKCAVRILRIGVLQELPSAFVSVRRQMLQLLAFEDWATDCADCASQSSFDASQCDGKHARGVGAVVHENANELGRAHASDDKRRHSVVVEYDGRQPLGIRLEKIVRPRDGTLLGARVVAMTNSDKGHRQNHKIEVGDELMEFRDQPLLGMNFQNLLAEIRATTSSNPSRLLFTRRLSQLHSEDRALASHSSEVNFDFTCGHTTLSFARPMTVSSLQPQNDIAQVTSFAMMTFDSTRVTYPTRETNEEQATVKQHKSMNLDTQLTVCVWDGTGWFSCLDPTELKCRTQAWGVQSKVFVNIVTDFQLNVTPASLLQLNKAVQSFLDYNDRISKSRQTCTKNCAKDDGIDAKVEVDTTQLILGPDECGEVEVYNTLGCMVDIALETYARFDTVLSQTAWERLDHGKLHTLSWKVSNHNMYVEGGFRAQHVIRVRVPINRNVEAPSTDAAHATRFFVEFQIATESCDGTFCKFLAAPNSFGNKAGKHDLESEVSDFSSEREIPVAWTVKVADSGRVKLQLHSTLLFENHLGTPVDLYFPPAHDDIVNTTVHGETYTIEAGERLSLPALKFETRCYHMRPHCVPGVDFVASSAYSDLLAVSGKSDLLNELDLYLVYTAFGADQGAACEWCTQVCAMDDTKKARQEMSNLAVRAGFQFNEAALQVGRSKQSIVCVRNLPLHERSLPHLCHVAHTPLVDVMNTENLASIVSFRAPIEVVNSLPYPVEVVVRSNGNSSASRVVHRVLRSGARCAVTAFHVRARPQIRVRMLWYAWSRWEDILLVGGVRERSKQTGNLPNGSKPRGAQKSAPGPRPQFLECQDQTSMVCISMLNRPGPAGNRIVTLFSRYVLRVAASSQLKLTFGHSTAADMVGMAGNHGKIRQQSQSEVLHRTSTKKSAVDASGNGNQGNGNAVRTKEARSARGRMAMIDCTNHCIITCRAGMPTSEGGFVVAVENQVFDQRALRWVDIDQMPAASLAHNKIFQLTPLLRELQAKKEAPLPHDKHWTWASTWEPIPARLLPLQAMDVKEQMHQSQTVEGDPRDGWWYAAKFKHMFQPWRHTSGADSSGASSRGTGSKHQAYMRSDFADGFYCRSRFVRRKFGFVDGLSQSTTDSEDDAVTQKHIEDALSNRFYPEARTFSFPWKHSSLPEAAKKIDNANPNHEHIPLMRAVCHHRFLHLRVGWSEWSTGVDLEALKPGGEPCEVTVFGSLPWPGRASTVHLLLVEKRSVTNVDTEHLDYVASVQKQRPSLALAEAQGHTLEASTCEIVVRSKLRLQNVAFGPDLNNDGIFGCRHNPHCPSKGHIWFRQQGTLNTDAQTFCARHGETVDYYFASHLEMPALQLAVQLGHCRAEGDSACSATQGDEPRLWSKCFRVDQHADFALRVSCADIADFRPRPLILRVRVDNGHVVISSEAANPLCVVRNHSSHAVEFLESSVLATAAVHAGMHQEAYQAVNENGGWSLCKPGEQGIFGWLDVHNRGFLVVRPASDCEFARNSIIEVPARVVARRAASSRDWVQCQASSTAKPQVPEQNADRNKVVYFSRSKALRVEISRFGTAFYADVFDNAIESETTTSLFEEASVAQAHRQPDAGLGSEFHVQIQADSILGVSVMTDELEELLLFTLTGTTGALRWLSRSNEITCVAASQRMQADCFLPLSHFPVMLHSQQSHEVRRSASLPTTTKRSEKPTTQKRLADVRFNFKGRSHAGQLRHVDFFHLSVGPMCANVDGRFISTLMGSYSPVIAVFSHTRSSVDGPPGFYISHAARTDDETLNNQISTTTPLVWETVVVDEVSVKLNFATSVDQPGFRARRASLAAFWRSLSRINDANLIFQRFARSSLRCSPLEFGNILWSHMKDLLWNKVLLLAGSMNALGNPLGLLGKVGEGTLDLVAGPLDGARGGGGLDGGIEGGIDGGISLVRNTINGVFQSAGGLTSTLATAAAHASMDPEYIARHSHGSGTVGVDRVDESIGSADPRPYRKGTPNSQGRQRSAKTALNNALEGEPRDIFDGVALGTLTLARGLWDGITDVYTQVRRSTRRRDEDFIDRGGDPSSRTGGSIADRQNNKKSAEKMVGRVMQGVGRGLLGTVVKPAVGVIDAATKVLDGVKNSTRHETEVQQQTRSQTTVRRQRPVYHRGNLVPSILPYNHDAATVCAVLRWLSFREFGQDQQNGGKIRSNQRGEVAIGRHDAASFVGHVATLDGVLVLVTKALLHLSTPGHGEPLKLVARIPWGSIIGFQCSGVDAARSHLRPSSGQDAEESSFVSKLTIRYQRSGRVAAHCVLTGYFTSPKASTSQEGVSIAIPAAPAATTEATVSKPGVNGEFSTPSIAKQATIALQPVLDVLLAGMRMARATQGVVRATTNLGSQPVPRTS